MEAEVVRLSKLLLVTLSVPIKPGAIHRFRLDNTFEQALEEAVHIISYAEDAYQRGVELRKGTRSLQTLGFGKIIYNSLVRAFEVLERRPLLGLHVAMHTSSLILGYMEEGDVYKRISGGIRILYRTTPDEVLTILDGMEASSLGDELRFLDNRGLTRRWIMLQGATLGDFYEIMSDIDTGFMLNLKGIRILKEVRAVVKDGGIYSKILKSYLKLAELTGMLKTTGIEVSMKSLLRLDRDIGYDHRFNRLLGGSFLATLISEDS